MRRGFSFHKILIDNSGEHLLCLRECFLFLYDTLMTSLWHLSDTFLTSFWHDFKTFHQIVSDLILINVSLLTCLWHVSDIFLTRFQNISSNRFWLDSDKCRFSDTFMTRFRHHYDTFMPRLWHLYDTFLTSAILKRKWMKFNSNKKKVGDAAVAFRLFRIAEVLHFRFPLPVSTSGCRLYCRLAGWPPGALLSVS